MRVNKCTTKYLSIPRWPSEQWSHRSSALKSLLIVGVSQSGNKLEWLPLDCAKVTLMASTFDPALPQPTSSPAYSSLASMCFQQTRDQNQGVALPNVSSLNCTFVYSISFRHLYVFIIVPIWFTAGGFVRHCLLL